CSGSRCRPSSGPSSSDCSPCARRGTTTTCRPRRRSQWRASASPRSTPSHLRICLVYDHLFPETIGGAERWMRDLALRLAERDHAVTYRTMRHWSGEAPPKLPGVRIVGLSRPGRVYHDRGRTLGPPLRFGLAVARHLARHGRAYDIVHTA